MKFKLSILLTSILLFMSSCGEKDYLVVIHTDYGDMKVILFDETPQHKENFLNLVRKDFYDSLIFHRVIQNFMIQGGDPDSKNSAAEQRLGAGGPGYTIPAEIVPGLYHEKGALSAARLGDQANPGKESSGSQFYIVHGQKFQEADLKEAAENVNYGKIVALLNRMFAEEKNLELLQELQTLQQAGDADGMKQKCFESLPIVEQEFGKQTLQEVSPEKAAVYEEKGGAPHLDGEYTIFGRVVEGQDVIDVIASQPTNQVDRPLTDIRIFITLEEISKKDVTTKYGYMYPEN